MTFVSTDVSTTAQGGSSHVEVSQKVESTNNSSVVYKRIETNVNGEYKVIESTDVGETKILITGKPPITITITPAPTRLPTQALEITKTSFSNDLVARIRNAISEILGRINFFSKQSKSNKG